MWLPVFSMDRGSFTQENWGGMMPLLQQAKACQTAGNPLDDTAISAVWNLETQDAVTTPGGTKFIGLSWFSDSSGFAAAGLSRAVFFSDPAAPREKPDFFTLDRFHPRCVQRAVLRDDETLFVSVEQNGIVPVRSGS
jgi:hypothetical protein